MTRLLLYFIILFSSFGCNNSTLDKTTLTTVSDSTIVSKIDTIPSTNVTASALTKLDSIDKANSKTISTDNKNYILKATVSKDDSLIWLTANMKLDHRIFGYDKPDTKSRKMILLSIFTNDIDGNPFNCPFGSYYQTSDMTNMKLKYISEEGNFIKVNVLKGDTSKGIIYIEKRWIEFEE